MAGTSGSFSLAEKLAVAGAFLAVVALGVGTEEDPGVVVAQTEQIAAKAEAVQTARPAPAPGPAATAADPAEPLRPETPAIDQGEADDAAPDNADNAADRRDPGRPPIDMRQRLLAGG